MGHRGEDVTRGWSGDAAAYRLDGCLDAVLEVELGEDAGDVVGDSVRADREVMRDLVVGVASGELGEDKWRNAAVSGRHASVSVLVASGNARRAA